MARINFSKIEKDTIGNCSEQREVRSTYSVFEDYGTKYFQINTYGKETRENPKVSSQTIQFDKDSAQSLVNLLKKEFGIE